MSRKTKPPPDPLAKFAAEWTGCNMRLMPNQATLQRWSRTVGEAQIRSRLPAVAYPYPRGGAVYHWSLRDVPENQARYLANWDWEVTAPMEKVFWFAL